MDPEIEKKQTVEDPKGSGILGFFSRQKWFPSREHQSDQNAQQVTLPIEFTNATGTKLDQLNDDCLLEIFSKHSLTPMDFLSLAETCKLFRRITQRVFPKRLSMERRHTGSYIVKSEDFETKTESADEVVRIFKCFGAGFVAISLNENEPHTVLNSIAKRCAAGILKELDVSGMKIPETLAVELEPLFQQLRLLSIANVNVECSANLFANCGELIELRIREVPTCTKFLVSNFPKLQRFSASLFSYPKNFERVMLSFIERHPTIQSFQLYIYHSKAIGDYLQKLGDSCGELEELDIAFDSGILNFSNFPRLKRLTLCRRYYLSDKPSIVELQKLKNSLESLKIIGEFDCKAFWVALSQLENLRELVLDHQKTGEKIQWSALSQLRKLHLLVYRPYIDSVVDIITHLTNLEELEVDTDDFVMSENELGEIVKVVKARPNVLSLRCRCEFDLTSTSVYHENSKVKLIKIE